MGSTDKEEKKKKKKSRKPQEFDVETGELGGGDESDSGTPAETGFAPSPEADQATESEPAPPHFAPEEPRRKRRRWPIVLIIVLVLAALLIGPRLLGFRHTAADTSGYDMYTIERGDITVTLSGSGTLEPADAYTLRPLVSGDILSAPFEEGDNVQKDTVLYKVDSSDVANSIEQAENTLADAQRSYSHAVEGREDLKMKSGGSGVVVDLNVKIGDTVTTGQTLATVRDSEYMTFTAMFQKSITEEMAVGDSIDVNLSETFENFTGTVTDVSPFDTVLTGSIVAREITIEVKNPGAFMTTQHPGATYNGAADISSTNFAYKYEGVVTATLSGIVDDVPVVVGTSVNKNQTIAMLHSDSVEQQIENAASAVRDARLALSNQTTRLDDYTIRSPISGTIVEKDYKEGDTLESGASMCTVFDLSYLTLTLKVDELDIKKVAVGQPVAITADASENAQYAGVVTKININGTTLNGVTSYPVTIRIENTEGLLPGMNVDATITISSLEDVVTIPVGALQRGNFVLLKSDAYNPDTAEPGIPEGFVYTEVTPGPSNDTSVVITDGLSAGDVIAVLDTTPSSYNTDIFMMGNGPSDESAPEGPDGGPAGDAG